MEAITERKIWTDEELMSLPDDGFKYELVDGEIVGSEKEFGHGRICYQLGVELNHAAEKSRSGIVVASSTGFRMRSGNVLCPDASFISIARIRAIGGMPDGFFEGAPDLAVEVLSPNDRIHALHRKLVKYFENGTKLCWVVNPKEETVYVYHSPARDTILTKVDTLDGEDVVPGFKLPVSELFKGLEF